MEYQPNDPGPTFTQDPPVRMSPTVRTPERRGVDPWKVRWCTVCRCYEFDAGAPKGWVPLKGKPPEAAKDYAHLNGAG